MDIKFWKRFTHSQNEGDLRQRLKIIPGTWALMIFSKKFLSKWLYFNIFKSSILYFFENYQFQARIFSLKSYETFMWASPRKIFNFHELSVTLNWLNVIIPYGCNPAVLLSLDISPLASECWLQVTYCHYQSILGTAIISSFYVVIVIYNVHGFYSFSSMGFTHSRLWVSRILVYGYYSFLS